MNTNWTEALNSLESTKAKIERQIECIKNLIELEQEHGLSEATTHKVKTHKATKHTAAPRPRMSSSSSGVKQMKLPALLIQIGQQHPHGMAHERFTELVQEAGYKSNSKNFSNMIYQCLTKLVKNGTFQKDDSTKHYQFTGVIS